MQFRDKRFLFPFFTLFLLALVCFFWADMWVATFLYAHQTNGWSWLKRSTTLYDPITLFIVVSTAALFNSGRLTRLWLLFLAGIPLFKITKIALGRPRPLVQLLDPSSVLTFFSFDNAYHSFPSGHTFATTMIILWCIRKWNLSSWWLLVPLALGSIRALVLKHFLSDILLTIDLGILFEGMMAYVWWRKKIEQAPSLLE